MINTIVELEAYFASKVSPVYSREKYDRFLLAYPFAFTIPSIHLTGTNGKGSTATFLRNLYQSRFKKVGLFTSPALSRFQEMIYINQEEIRDDYILAFFQKWQPLFDQYELTAFEMQTLLAFHYFHDQGCDFAIIEVGMGGKIDATNIFTPVLSIITNISLEHRAYLGNTLASIADHKAGIIKPKVPVLVGPLPVEAMRVVEQVSQSLQAPLYHRQPYQVINANPPLSFRYGKYPPLTLSMSANYQLENAALALAAVDILQSRYPLKADAIKQAIYQTFMPGRLEVIKQSPLIILDGAHNPGGIEALIKAMTHHDHRSLYVLFAAFKDKEIDPMLAQLRGLSKHIFITTFPHPRARKKSDFPGINEPIIEDYEQAIHVLTKGIPNNGVLLITGSLAFIGLVRQKLLK